ncbi:MAG TPA: hypothetical protein VFF10_09805 [Trueperaceae bacterium]|nr:hypothetical protein [Trueperaceae bacterium]
MNNAAFLTFLIVCFVVLLGLLFIATQQINEIEHTMEQIEQLRELKRQLDGPAPMYEA